MCHVRMSDLHGTGVALEPVALREFEPDLFLVTGEEEVHVQLLP